MIKAEVSLCWAIINRRTKINLVWRTPWVPRGRRFSSLACKANRRSHSFVPIAVRLVNRAWSAISTSNGSMYISTILYCLTIGWLSDCKVMVVWLRMCPADGWMCSVDGWTVLVCCVGGLFEDRRGWGRKGEGWGACPLSRHVLWTFLLRFCRVCLLYECDKFITVFDVLLSVYKF